MKKVISLAIIVMMVLGLANFSVLAEENVDYIVVDDNTVRILTATGWNEIFATYNVAGKTVYVEGDIEINARIKTLNATLIGNKGGNGEKPVVTLGGVTWFQGMAANSSITNFILCASNDNVISFTSSGYQGILVQNITVSGVTVSDIVNNVSATTEQTDVNALGMIGSINNSDVVISNCINNGNFTNVTTADGTDSFAGGILGALRSASDEPQIINCINNGDISAKSAVGGIVGGSAKDDNNITIKNCKNTGAVTGTDTNSFTGGILGSTRSNSTIENCINEGTVTSNRYAGGISGGIAFVADADTGKRVSGTACYTASTSSSEVSIISCVNIGDITAADRYVGGMLGCHAGNAEILKCANLGAVTATKNLYAGGMAGLFNGSVDQSYNQGNITAKANLGGIVGGSNNVVNIMGPQSISITNSYNTGMVTATDDGAGGIGYYLGTTKTEGVMNQVLSSVYNAGEVNSAVGKHVYGVARALSKSSEGSSATVNNVYALTDGKIDINIPNPEDTTKSLKESEVSYTALTAKNEAGFEMLPDGFDSDVWVACEGAYPILKNNLPKNADGTDKEYVVVTLNNGENGAALKDKVTYVEKGTDYKLTLIPLTGYKVDTVKVGETEIDGISNVYIIENVSENISVSATYVVNPVAEGVTGVGNLFPANDSFNSAYTIYAFARYNIVDDNEITDYGVLVSFEEVSSDDYSGLKKCSALIEGETTRFGAQGAYINDELKCGEYGIKLYGNLITEEGTYYCIPYAEYEDGTICYGSVMTK